MCTRRPFRLRRAAASLVAALLSTTAAPAASAGSGLPDDRLGWSACRWAPGEVIAVGVSPRSPFPDPAFSDRLDEAVGRWDAALGGTAARPRMIRHDTAPDVVVEYGGTAGHDGALAETFLRRRGDLTASADIGRCPDRRPARFAMAGAVVAVAGRDDWFTGPDSDLGRWQACGRALAQMVVVNCADRVDFGSTITHELGHTLVAYHPQMLDAVDGRPVDQPGSATATARCVEAAGNFDQQATMCAAQGRWRGEQRSLSAWDVETVRRLYGAPGAPSS